MASKKKQKELNQITKVFPTADVYEDEVMDITVHPIAKPANWAEKRNNIRDNFLDDILDEFHEKPEPEKPPPPIEYKAFYKLRRKIGCGCAHVPLNIAILEGTEAEVKRTLRRLGRTNPDKINEYDFKGRTPLSLAIKEKREDIADMILGSKFCDVNKPDKKTGLSPLHHCVQLNLLSTIQKLSWRECIVDPEDNKGMTPLMLACSIGNMNAVEMLIYMSADFEAKDGNGWGPIHYACYGGNLQIVEFLVSQSADYEALDNKKRTPTYIAEHKGFGDIVSFLENYVPPHGQLI